MRKEFFALSLLASLAVVSAAPALADQYVYVPGIQPAPLEVAPGGQYMVLPSAPAPVVTTQDPIVVQRVKVHHHHATVYTDPDYGPYVGSRTYTYWY